MRIVLASLLFLAVALAAPNGYDASTSSLESLPNYYPKLESSDPIHVRAKRAIYAALGIANSCEAGWTGQTCANPVCDHQMPPLSSGQSVLIEMLFLQGSCSGEYYIPVDAESAKKLQIHISASGVPYVNLTNSAGQTIPSTNMLAQDGYSLTVYEGIPGGGYSLSIDNQNAVTTECIVEVMSDSTLKVAQAFVNSPQSDEAPYGESTVDGVPMYFVAHLENAPLPSQALSVSIRQGNSLSPVYRSVLTNRYQCGYEYYAGQWQCEIGSSFYFHVDGIDASGFEYRRTGRFSCMEHLTTKAPSTPTTPPLSICYNNGTLLTPAGGQPTCFCSELFTGTQCEKVNCMNAGFSDPDGNECVCAEGYHGTNCQDVTCPINWAPTLTDYKTLIVIIHSTVSMNQYLSAISTAVYKELTNNKMYDTDVYKGFVLIKFSNGKYVNTYYPVYNENNFLSDLKNSSSTVGGCEDVTFDAIASIFTEVSVYQKSPIYLFTDVIASDSDKWETIIHMNTRQKYPIYTSFFVQDGCSFDDMSSGFQAIEYVTGYSGGMMLRPDSSQLELILQMVIKATTYKMNSVLIDDMQACSSPTRVFFVDSSTTDLFVLAVGESLTVTVTDPNGSSNTLLPIIANGTTFFYEIANPVVGEHLLTIVSSTGKTPCSYRVQARSEYDLFIGTSTGVSDDASESEPVFGETTHVVAQLTGLKNNVADPFRLFSEISITSNINNEGVYQKPMYYSSGKYRDGCGFHMYFGAASFCDFVAQPFYATVYADDGKGFTIQRTTMGFCSGSATTPLPPNTCVNGGVSDPSNKTTCICPPNYTGEFCQNIQCVNGGTPNGGHCACPVGMGGTFCEEYACTNVNTQPDVSFDGQSLAFVISTRSTMNTTINTIANNVQTMVRDIQQASTKWINRWILIVTNSNTSTVLVNSDHPADFVAGVITLSANFDQYVQDGINCQVQLEQAMLGAAVLSEKRSSVWVFADSDGPDDSSYVQLYTISQEYRISLNLVGVGSSICTSTENNGQFPYYLRSLVEITMGDIYMTSQVDQVMMFIVSLYKSAVSHRNFIEDCTNKTSYYMPVDGWTQSLTLAVTGTDLLSVEITFPDGSLASNSYYEITAINNPELKLNQYVAECDTFWDAKNQNCYLYESTKYSWIDSWTACHSDAAFLIQIENQDINDYVYQNVNGYRLWLGLTFNNGTWYWDIPDNAYSQPLTGYSNWDSGVDPQNPKYTYAVMNANGKWEPADPTELNFLGCMKHRYGQGIYPGESTNMIPAGLWKVTVQSNSGSCEIQARSQSEIQVFFGFSTDPRSDNPTSYANIDSTNNYLLAIPTGVEPYTPETRPSMEGKLNYAILINNRTITNSLPLNNRLCSYSVISFPFTCPNNNDLVSDLTVKFTGIDQYGYAFERYVDALCMKDVTTCYNGGFINNGKCVCRGGWTGKTCSTPVCQNGGIEKNGVCDCSSVPQFTGQFCQHAHCEPPYPTTFNDKERTLAIILETSYNMASTIYQLKRNLKASLDSINNDPTLSGWFSNYILYPFDSTENKDYWYAPTISSNSDDIVTAVNNITIMSCPGPNPCSTQCPRPIVSVISSVLNMTEFSSPNSVILVITRSSAEDYLQVGSIAQQLMDTKAYINFVYPSIDSPCSEGFNTPAVDALYQITSYSAGNLFTMTSIELSQNFLKQYIPTLYSSSGLAASSGQCQNDEILFQVEHEMYEFSIDFFHPLMEDIKVFDPLGEQIDLPDSIISSDTNYIAIVPVNESSATRAGTYRIVLSGSGGNNCFTFIRGRSNLELYLGFVDSSSDSFNGATVDAANHAPVNLENNTIVVHANNLGEGIVRYVQVVMPGFGLVHTTEMKRRDSECSYEWYSATPYSFDYSHYFVIVYGGSEYGSNWQRNFYISTVGTRPVNPPPPASCDLSKIKQDTLFLIDSSVKDSNITNTILKQFAATSVQPYSYSDGLAQVAAISVAGTPKGGFSFNSNENSFDRVYSLLLGLDYLGTEGQNVTAALDYVLKYYDEPAQGYRTDADVRHLLVYITNTNPTDADPSSLISTIKRAGLYEVIVIALDMEPSDKLTNMVSSRCYYYAEDYSNLMSYGVNLVQLQSCMRFNFCNY